MYLNNLARINKQVRISSSLSLLHKKALNVSKQVGQSANPYRLEQAGGPGDLIHSKTPSLPQDGSVTYRLPINKRRIANKSKMGVDKKHGSYSRYLARRVGGELRKEKMPTIRNHTAFIHQPRNRTGTAAGCFSKSGKSGLINFLGTRTAFKCNDATSQQTLSNTNLPNNIIYPKESVPYNSGSGYGVLPLFGPSQLVGQSQGSCCSEHCCHNRIPGDAASGHEFICDNNNNCSRNPNSINVSGLLGKNTQGVAGGRCSCNSRCTKWK